MQVLYATDGRPPAVAAGELLRRLAVPERVAVTILHAAEYGNPAVAGPYGDMVVGEAEAAFASSGFACRTIRCDEDPVACIGKELAGEAYALTAVGAGNHPWLDRLVFGSVSSYLLHHARVPVLAVHRVPDPQQARIRALIGADGSTAAEGAIETLLQITDPGRTELHVASVVEPVVTALAPHPGAVPPPPYVDDVLAERRAAADAAIRHALDRLGARGFSADAVRLEGPTAPELLRRAEEVGADVVVLGARGLGPIARLTVGSVSAHVARHAPAALVAHAPDHPANGPG